MKTSKDAYIIKENYHNNVKLTRTNKSNKVDLSKPTDTLNHIVKRPIMHNNPLNSIQNKVCLTKPKDIIYKNEKSAKTEILSNEFKIILIKKTCLAIIIIFVISLLVIILKPSNETFNNIIDFVSICLAMFSVFGPFLSFIIYKYNIITEEKLKKYTKMSFIAMFLPFIIDLWRTILQSIIY